MIVAAPFRPFLTVVHEATAFWVEVYDGTLHKGAGSRRHFCEAVMEGSRRIMEVKAEE